ncbi:major capsid protein [Azospirillum brasilense]|nr:major capsid protein [Azospirillum brasilense]
MSGNNSFVYDTNTLIAVVPNLKRSTSFLLDRFFPNLVVSDSEYVSMDVDVGLRRMAPFVSPLVQGKLVEQRRIQTNSFKPAYIKDKRAPDLRKPVRRMIGERIGGDMTGAEREMANLEMEMTDQIDILTRRIEWMAAQVLSTGTVTISGDGFETVVVDFGRDGSLSVALTGSNKWGVSANFNPDGRDPVPTKHIEHWQHQILKKSGAKATDIIFTTSPWLKFLNAEGVQGAIYYPKLGETAGLIDNGPNIDRGGVFKGRWGQYNLWLYNEWFIDDDGVEQPMLADGTVIMSGPDMMGTRAFGMILDPKFSYQALPFAPKTWVEEDPPQRLLMMQSAPITIPGRVNAALAATVCDAEVQ